MHLNLPETIPAPACEKTVFHETGLWYQKGWGILFYSICKMYGVCKTR